VKITKARNEDPVLIHASRKPDAYHAFWSRKCDWTLRQREEIPFTPAQSPAKPQDTDHTFKYLTFLISPLNHPSMQASPVIVRYACFLHV
jgi:hypothetical protein